MVSPARSIVIPITSLVVTSYPACALFSTPTLPLRPTMSLCSLIRPALRRHTLPRLPPLCRQPPFRLTSALFSNTSFQWNGISQLTAKLQTKPKKKKKLVQNASIQNLRRNVPAKLRQSVAYILSLLNKNGDKPTEALDELLMPVTAVTVGDGLDFEKAVLLLDRLELSHRVLIADEVIAVDYHGNEVVLLASGSLVGWGMKEDTFVADVVPQFASVVVHPCSPESDELDWIELGDSETQNAPHNGTSFMLGEVLVIQGNDPEQKLLDKAAFAIGISRSTRLSVIENALEEHIQMTKTNLEYLSVGKQITTTESDVLKLTGRLFLLRGKLNLYSELIETPDLYWTEPNLEKIYESVSKILDIHPRISILNRKLDYATEEQRALLSVLNEKKSTRLEWIIIVLIMVEVCFETFHFYEKYAEKPGKTE